MTISHKRRPLIQVHKIIFPYTQIDSASGPLWGGDMEAYLRKKQELMDIEKKMSFSYDLEATLTDEERAAEGILAQWRKKELKDDMYNIVIHDYFENFDKLRNSKIYEMLDKMPKGALHHLHTSAAPSADAYVKLTYNDYVYFNEREKVFKVAPVSIITQMTLPDINIYVCYRKDSMKMASSSVSISVDSPSPQRPSTKSSRTSFA